MDTEKWSKDNKDYNRRSHHRTSQERAGEENGRSARDEATRKDEGRGELSNIPPPKRLSDVKQELKQMSQSMQPRDGPVSSQQEAPFNSQKDTALSNKQSYART
jgi:hypothetical protein